MCSVVYYSLAVVFGLPNDLEKRHPAMHVFSGKQGGLIESLSAFFGCADWGVLGAPVTIVLTGRGANVCHR
jgi:hypothetical protein